MPFQWGAVEPRSHWSKDEREKEKEGDRKRQTETEFLYKEESHEVSEILGSHDS